MCKADFINGRRFLRDVCKKNEPECTFTGKTAEEFTEWRNFTLDRLKKLLCFPELLPVPYNAEFMTASACTDTVTNRAYERQLWYIDTLPGLKMPVYVLIPEEGSKKTALALHCHGSDGKNGLVGLADESIRNNQDRFGLTYAFELLRKGYTVFCPDILGSGERKPLTVDKSTKSDCTELNFSLMSVGLNLQGVITCELMRCIDFIGHFENTNADELICVGFSGGGLAALWLAALDERVKTAYVSGYFHSFKSTLLHSNFCGCNFIPGLWNIIDADALAMLIAPRRLFVETGEGDKLNGIDGLESVNRLVERTKRAYKEFCGSEAFEFKVCSGAHRWYGVFMDRIQ